MGPVDHAPDPAPSLSPTALAALVTAAVPGVEPTGVHVWHLQSRRDYQVARVEDSSQRFWVVRSPLTTAAGAQLERLDTLLRLLAPHLPFGVPVAEGFTDRLGVGRAGVYPALEGSPIRLDTLPPGRGLASALGRAIAALHNVPLGVFEEAGVPGYEPDAYRRRLLAHLDRAAESGHVPNGLLARWEHALEHQALWRFTPVGTHGSLDGSSLLTAFAEDDAASGRVTALVGWDGPQVADPADDLAFIAADSPPGALESVIDSYAMARTGGADAYLTARARLAAEMIDVHDLSAAVESGDHQRVATHAEALRRLDRYTSGSPSLVPERLLSAPSPVTTPAPVPVSEAPADDGADSPWRDDEDATGEIHSPFVQPTVSSTPAEPEPEPEPETDGTWGTPAPEAEAEPQGASLQNDDPVVEVEPPDPDLTGPMPIVRAPRAPTPVTAAEERTDEDEEAHDALLYDLEPSPQDGGEDPVVGEGTEDSDDTRAGSAG